MPNLNENEYGQVVRVNLDTDISTGTDLKFILEPQFGDKLEREAPDVTVGASDVVVDDETYLADEYLEYTIEDGDLTHIGKWRLKGEAVVSSVKIVSDYKLIEVLA